MSDVIEFDNMFTIQCGKCGEIWPLNNWCENINGPMPTNTFQCPSCGFTFKRQPKVNRQAWDKFVELVEVKP